MRIPFAVRTNIQKGIATMPICRRSLLIALLAVAAVFLAAALAPIHAQQPSVDPASDDSQAADATPAVEPSAPTTPAQAAVPSNPSDEPGSSGGTDAAEQLQAWISQLGAPEYYVRQQAVRQIRGIGVEAYDALAAASEYPDVEVRLQAEALLDQLRIRQPAPQDPPDVQRLLTGYADRPEDERERRLEALTSLPPEVGLPVLCRLVRVEESSVLCKRAALFVMDRLTTKADTALVASPVRTALGNSQRLPADWIRMLLDEGDDPQQRMALWERVIQQEHERLLHGGGDTNEDVFSGLVRWYVRRLKTWNQVDRALDVAERFLPSLTDPTEELRELAELFIERQQWAQLDENFRRFESVFRGDASLLYLYAEALAKQQRHEQAGALAADALEHEPRQPSEHLQVARELEERSMHDWAVREYQRGIDKAGIDDVVGIFASRQLAELLHDMGKHREAAEALQPLKDQLDQNPAFAEVLSRAVGRSDVGAIFSRMYYFYAEHERSEGNRAEQIAQLRLGTAADPTDADLLIARYRVQGADEAWQRETRQLIANAAQQFRSQAAEIRQQLQILTDPEIQEQLNAYLAQQYNQFAWLVSNTEGNYQEALEYSKKSLELNPDHFAYLDTLARCYFAVGDLENAIRNQRRAVELAPYVHQIRRQLEEFEAAAASAGQPADDASAANPTDSDSRPEEDQ